MFNAAMFDPATLNKAAPAHYTGGAVATAPGDLGLQHTNGGRTPEDVLGSDGRAGRPSTSGSVTPLSENRHAARPGSSRHPQTGRFTRGEGTAAGHADLNQQPTGRGVFPSRGDGPFAAQTPDNMVRPSHDVRPGQMFGPEHCLPDSVKVNRLDLAGAAGLPSGLAHPVDPTPSQVQRQTGQTDMANPRAQVTPGDIDSGPGPLAMAIRGHMAGGPAFGFTPADLTGDPPGWA